MPKPVLLLRLEGPLQSWGGRSRWDVRDTQTEPTKSGVVGLLGCALGYERGDLRLEELDRSLIYGVRVEAKGRQLEDYQTITDYLPTAKGSFKHSGDKTGSSLSKIRESDFGTSTIVSPRFYLEDAAFLVGLEAREASDENLLFRAAKSLKNPRWTLFLGRKACVPTRPIFEVLTDQYNDVSEALRQHPWEWLDPKISQVVYDRVNLPSKLECFVEASDGSHRRQDAMRVNPLRQYGYLHLKRFEIPLASVRS